MFFQIYFYHNVKCRQEMYDKDILMLQVLCMWLELLRIVMDNFVLFIFFIIQKVFLKSLEMQFFSGIFPIHFIDVGGWQDQGR